MASDVPFGLALCWLVELVCAVRAACYLLNVVAGGGTPRLVRLALCLSLACSLSTVAVCCYSVGRVSLDGALLFVVFVALYFRFIIAALCQEAGGGYE